MNFTIRILLRPRFESFESLDVPSPFRTRFGNLNKLILCSSVRARFRVFDDLVTSSLFRMRFEVMFLSSSARGLEWFRSSSARGLTRNLSIHWYFYPPPLEVRSWFLIHWFVRFAGPTIEGQSNLVLFRSYTWKPVKLGSVPVLHLKTSQTWFCSGLTLESQSNLVLFRSYTWKPIKLGSVSVLHLKADQTCNFNFVICLPTWTYPSLPDWLRFWLCHACLLN